MSKKIINKVLAITVLSIMFSFTSTVFAGDADEKSTITTEQLRVILPPSVARSTSAYGIIKNTGDTDDTLINTSTDAGMILLHKTEIKDGMAQMNHVDDFELKAGEELILKPMSYHLMFMNINHDIIKKGGEVSLTLEFEKAGKLELKLPVLSE